MFEKINCTYRNTEAIRIKDLGKYDLAATMECGQCFRYERITDTEMISEYYTVVGSELIHVGQPELGELIFFNMTDSVFQTVALNYFALERDLAKVKEEIISHTDSLWLRNAAELGEGVAILNQEPFEALISFIISQNNNIPRIRGIIRRLCAALGVNLALQFGYAECPMKQIGGAPCQEICSQCGRCYTFPNADGILAGHALLPPLGVGFRYRYILDAAEKIADGTLDLAEIKNRHSYEYSLEQLKKVTGVGDKVASCVALFSLDNLDAFPIDVWMKRAIDEYFGGKLDHTSLGKYAGIAQQYIFHYIRNVENGKKNDASHK